MKRNYLFYLIIFGLLYSCSKQKIEYKHYETGEIKEKIVFDRENPNSYVAYLFSKDGNLLKEIKIKNGLYQGLCKSYYKNGNINDIVEFDQGKKNGSLTVFWENGNIRMHKNYVNDTVHGIARNYNEDGSIKEEFLFINSFILIHKKYFQSRDGTYLKFENYKAINDSSFLKNGQLVINTATNTIDIKKSLYYDINIKKDTISINDSLELEIKFINSYPWKTKFLYGDISSNGNLIDTISEYSGINNIVKVKILPKKEGYNLLLGKLIVDLDTLKKDAHYEFIVYKEFYVD